jgi:hypothetical protein
LLMIRASAEVLASEADVPFATGVTVCRLFGGVRRGCTRAEIRLSFSSSPAGASR